jgi:SMC interacting uncharacterized protein involved in chromosome segregation
MKGDLAEVRAEMKGGLAEVKGGLAEMKGDLAEVRSELKRDLEDFKVEVNMRFEAFEHRMGQFLSDMEARIITSNYRLAESMNQRIKQGEGNQAAFNARLATLEERLLEVEKRLNMPPAA